MALCAKKNQILSDAQRTSSVPRPGPGSEQPPLAGSLHGLVQSALPLFEIARVLVLVDHVARFIMPERVLVLIDYIRPDILGGPAGKM
jgi:hypothetical protein